MFTGITTWKASYSNTQVQVHLSIRSDGHCAYSLLSTKKNIFIGHDDILIIDFDSPHPLLTYCNIPIHSIQ